MKGGGKEVIVTAILKLDHYLKENKALYWKEGPQKGQPLSASRVSNILIVLRAIWNDAVKEYQWERSDPFAFIKRFLSKELKTRPQKPEPKVFRFDEWQKVIACIHPYHRPVAEFMIMSGTIGSASKTRLFGIMKKHS